MTSIDHLARDGRSPAGRPAAAGDGPAVVGRAGWLRFGRHYLEMVVAMFAGMVVLGAAFRGLLALAGVEPPGNPEFALLEMGVTMALGMLAWMRVRRHRWAPALEMSAAMLVPAAGVIPLLWLGVLDAMAAMVVEHVVMFPLMLALMLLRRGEYLTYAHGRPPVRPPSPGSAPATPAAPGGSAGSSGSS